MQFPDSYFEDEVREGFYISSLMKRAWAAQEEVLEIVQGVCRKHGIRYFAEWGALLGAVRHGGRIPWDDDIDICMLREDFERFAGIADAELPENCWFMAPGHTEGFTNDVARVINSRVHVVEGEALRQYHGFPYVAGIDIFWIDEVPGGEGYVTNLPVWEVSRAYQMPCRCFEDALCVSYDVMQMMVSSRYDELLERKYGAQWMNPVRAGGSHGYPTYNKQKEFLERENGAVFGGYRFPAESGSAGSPAESGGADSPAESGGADSPAESGGADSPAESGSAGSPAESGSADLSPSLQERIRELLPVFSEAHEEICRQAEAGNALLAGELLQDCQNLAIQVGTMIEEERGEGHPTVKLLEEYCEMLWQMSGMA